METGAAETGAAETGAAETGAVETGAAETGAAETGAAETAAVETGVVEDILKIFVNLQSGMEMTISAADVQLVSQNAISHLYNVLMVSAGA